MIKSMTGYGSAKGESGGLTVTVELKSVNNRYLDCSVRMPRNLLFAEETVKAAVQRHISRGKVDVFVTLDAAASSDVTVRPNLALAAEYAAAVGAVAEALQLPAALDAFNLSRMQDVLSVERKEPDAEALTLFLNDLANRALTDFDAMRAREGERMAADVETRLDSIEAMVAAVEARSPQTVSEYRDRLYRKMCEVLEKTDVDPQRILLEAAVFADKVAVDEETVRLRSHISQMRGFLAAGSPIGRKLDFLIQEFNREANTIGSKCTDAEITRTVIELKGEIEKIREQIQNIE